ncbi:MAG: hypothetical protein KDC26_01260 [Armatimonadetes bacterium]|nr:hypothetical protein [Armatimonadota bacterium]
MIFVFPLCLLLLIGVTVARYFEKHAATFDEWPRQKRAWAAIFGSGAAAIFFWFTSTPPSFDAQSTLTYSIVIGLLLSANLLIPKGKRSLREKVRIGEHPEDFLWLPTPLVAMLIGLWGWFGPAIT